MKTIFNRLREPSTWAGFGVLASIAGVPPNTFQLAQQIILGVVGLVAVIRPEMGAQ